jgi:hypothetical protein
MFVGTVEARNAKASDAGLLSTVCFVRQGRSELCSRRTAGRILVAAARALASNEIYGNGRIATLATNLIVHRFIRSS